MAYLIAYWVGALVSLLVMVAWCRRPGRRLPEDPVETGGYLLGFALFWPLLALYGLMWGLGRLVNPVEDGETDA